MRTRAQIKKKVKNLTRTYKQVQQDPNDIAKKRSISHYYRNLQTIFSHDAYFNKQGQRKIESCRELTNEHLGNLVDTIRAFVSVMENMLKLEKEAKLKKEQLALFEEEKKYLTAKMELVEAKKKYLEFKLKTKDI